MKIIVEDIDHRKSGRVEIMPEEDEDLWHIYNIIRIRDSIKCSTYRKHHKESTSGVVSTARVRINIILRVTKVEYEPPDLIRISGKNIAESKFIKIGQFHTVKLHVGKKISIGKGYWDSVDIGRLNWASDVANKAEVAAVVMEEGLAHVCLITGSMTLVRQRIEMSVSKKRYQSSHEKSLDRFFESVMLSILHYIDFAIVKVLIIGSPGFVRDQFMEYIDKQQNRPECKIFNKEKQRILLCHVNSGHKQALAGVFRNKQVQRELEKTKCMEEVQEWERFNKLLTDSPNQAAYGKRVILKCQDNRAIESLLITDKLFKSLDVKERMMWVRITEDVKNFGGKVYIFSSMHPSGECLDRLSGVAAILRFPMLDLFQIVETESEDSEDYTITGEEEEPKKVNNSNKIKKKYGKKK